MRLQSISDFRKIKTVNFRLNRFPPDIGNGNKPKIKWPFIISWLDQAEIQLPLLTTGHKKFQIGFTPNNFFMRASIQQLQATLLFATLGKFILFLQELYKFSSSSPSSSQSSAWFFYSISSLKENLLCASHFFRHPERPDKWWCLSPRSPLWPPSNRSPSPWQADAIGAIKVLGLAKTFTLLPPAARVTFCNSNWKQHQNFIIIITFSTVVTLTINPLLVACFWGWEPERCERDREGDARPSSLSLFLVVSISNFGVYRQSPKIIIIIIMIANVNLRNLECCLN